MKLRDAGCCAERKEPLARWDQAKLLLSEAMDRREEVHTHQIENYGIPFDTHKILGLRVFCREESTSC